MENISLENLNVVITLGGKGTRLSEITKGIPKPLWRICGMSTLERATKVISEQGINDFIWIINYKADDFREELNMLTKKYNVNIQIYQETIELGEAGSLLEIYSLLNESFLFINGDIIFDIDIIRFYQFHILNNADITFITHLTNHPEDSDCISETPSLNIYDFKYKSDKNNLNDFYLGNAGIALIQKKIVNFVKSNAQRKKQNLSLFNDFIIFSHINKFKVFSYNTSEYLKDMGTSKRLLMVENDIKSNLISNNSYRIKQKALFLDRDNTLIKCEESNYILNKDQIEIIDNHIDKIKKVALNYNFIILITNQPQIAMGKVSYQEVININSKLILMCQQKGLNIACVYLCPHHPHAGFVDEIESLKKVCFCRKPMPGLFYEASINRNICLESSHFIGDSWRDSLSANKLNMKFSWIQNLK